MKCVCPFGFNLILGLLCSQTVGDSNDYISYSYRTERMRWIEAFTPQNQGDSDDKIYESWGIFVRHNGKQHAARQRDIITVEVARQVFLGHSHYCVVH